MKMKQHLVRLVAVIALMSLTATAQTGSDDSKSIAAIQQELTKMGRDDQEHRQKIMELSKKGINDPNQSKELSDLWEKQNAIDEANMKRLEQIIKEHGWPGISKVGMEAGVAAFLILQHADLSYQEKYLPLLKEAVARNDARAADVAMLEDRVLMRNNKKQIYGSQLKSNKETNKLELWPIEDEENVDARRAKVGLMPLADYLKRFGLDYTPPKKN